MVLRPRASAVTGVYTGLLTFCDTTADLIDFTAHHPTTFISHQWLGTPPYHPHAENTCACTCEQVTHLAANVDRSLNMWTLCRLLGTGAPDPEGEHFAALCHVIKALCLSDGVKDGDMFLWLE